ncbi:MAG TPA: transglutaminaseTgpA domain-containing protein [Candidatus Limnocylindria bacterium]
MSEWLRPYLRPREGWLALGLLFVMLLSLGWSIQEAAWIDSLEFIVPVAFFAVVLGALFGLSRLSVAIVLPLSAVLGTAIVLWTVGGEFFPDYSQGDRLLALRGEAIRWARIVFDLGYAPQLTPYAIGLGVLMWVTSFIAAYTLYRHHRVLDAIVLVGAALIGNMAATLTDLFGYLILFVLAALLLWLRAALIGREEGWQRRRVNENAEVPAAIMRSGIVFIAGSIALAWVLTTVAVAAPLTNVWNNLDGAWTDLRDGLDGFFGGLSGGGPSRFGGASFGNSMTISGNWTSQDDPVMTVASLKPYYLRTITYDVYTGRGWDRTPGDTRLVPAETALFQGDSPERPSVIDAFRPETLYIQIETSLERNLFTPGYPTGVTADVTVFESGNQPFLGGMKLASPISPGEGYVITALIGEATEAQLQSAGQAYPPEIEAYYLGTEGVTQQTFQLAEQIVADAGARNPHDMAKALAAYLRGSGFRYDTTAPIPSDPDRDIVDFFLFDENGRVGYCEYFASAMAVMARTLGLPARVAVGFAPGDRIGDGEGEGSIYLVRRENAHAWAEIYFPGYGWQAFESTKTISALTRPRGQPLPSGAGGPQPSGGPRDFPEGLDRDQGLINTLPSFRPGAGGYQPGEQGPPEEPRGGNALLFLAILTLGLGVAAWRFLRSRRALRFLAPGERQWHRLRLAAGRAGVAQRPSETIYEYAGWLEEQIPRRRPEIQTIAKGKVWQSYSGHGISGEAIDRIERAWRRLELPLVWLAVKRRVQRLLPSR